MTSVPRLINKFIPENYQLSINLHRVERKFNGVVTLIGNSVNNATDIELHAKDLTINSITLDGKSAAYSHNDDSLIIELNNSTNDRHIVVIDFAGKINDTMHGVYPCYFEHGGIKKELIATQFESHHAREAFPCIDEPEAKATFDLTLTTETDVTVLGNTPVKFQRQENDNLVTCFETTPRMSTYLLAWVVGELQKKSATTKDGIEVNVWATPVHQPESLDFALDIAVRSIEFYNDYFKTPYPLKKCDHVALPDFSSGAMENWGLITYREIALLADPKSTSIASKRYIATVIAHELSHQWFGNLVTMKWWNDLWLNESFASLVEYTAIDSLEPDWQVWLDFATFDSIIALKRDSLDGVQPVQIDVNSPEEISTLFDGAIVYAKGARLLQMLQNFIGEDAFRNGLSKYFKKFAYKNTIDTDLWQIFSEECGIDIAKFMKPWLSQPGFPVVKVNRVGNTIQLSQRKLSSPNTNSTNTLWPIPINANHKAAPTILDQETAEFITDDENAIRLNIGNTAHFITQYSSTMLDNIVEMVKNNQLSTIDRLQLINEQSILANAGLVSYAEIIKLLPAFSLEDKEAVWDIISLTIGELKKFVSDDDLAEQKLKSFVGTLVKSEFNRLGWNPIAGETENDIKLRSIILGLMIYGEDKDVIDEAITRYNSSKLEALDPELRALLISVAVRENRNPKIIDDLIATYQNSTSAELKQDINIGLTATKDQALIDRLLDLIKDNSFVRTQDCARWIAYLLRNKYGRDKTWQWIRDNWKWIEETFSGDKSYDDYPRYAATCLSTKGQLQEFRDFFLPMINNPSLTRVINIGINEITDRVRLIETDGDNVKQALNDF